MLQNLFYMNTLIFPVSQYSKNLQKVPEMCLRLFLREYLFIECWKVGLKTNEGIWQQIQIPWKKENEIINKKKSIALSDGMNYGWAIF